MKKHTVKYLLVILVAAAIACNMSGISTSEPGEDNADTSSDSAGDEDGAGAEEADEAEPTATAEPEPTELASIPGIDEPLAIEGGEFHIEKVTVEESSPPDDPDDIYLTLFVDQSPNLLEWGGEELVLVCDGSDYEVQSLGIYIGEEGILGGAIFTFVIPDDTDQAGCRVRIEDGPEVPLAPFFE